MLHVRNIYLHVGDIWGKCRYIPYMEHLGYSIVVQLKAWKHSQTENWIRRVSRGYGSQQMCNLTSRRVMAKQKKHRACWSKTPWAVREHKGSSRSFSLRFRVLFVQDVSTGMFPNNHHYSLLDKEKSNHAWLWHSDDITFSMGLPGHSAPTSPSACRIFSMLLCFFVCANGQTVETITPFKGVQVCDRKHVGISRTLHCLKIVCSWNVPSGYVKIAIENGHL